MSILTLQLGQCGNQVGEVLYSTLFEDIGSCCSCPYLSQSFNKWFEIHRDGRSLARTICIDAETKVVNSRKRNPHYDFMNTVSEDYGGSANNWAYGFNSLGKMLSHSVLDKIRKHLERTDFTTTFFNILSSSGGTGSGIGSKIIEDVKEEYPSKTIMNAIILPFISGDFITQNYNTVLSLSKLHDISDLSFLFQNDRLFQFSSKKLFDAVNFENLNRMIASQIASTFQPINDECNDFHISQMTSGPIYKYVSLGSTYSDSKYSKYECNQSWSVMLNDVMKEQIITPKSESNGIKHKSIKTAVITRGQDEPTRVDFDFMKHSRNFVTWMPIKERFQTFHVDKKFCQKDRTATIISNDNSNCFLLDTILEDAWTLFSKKAYLHHFQKYDVGTEEFQEAFQKLENILAAYKNL